MTFGTLSGLQPLLLPGSPLAFCQTAAVLTLQLGMAMLCFCFLPDADRIIARFAASQFLFEGFSTGTLLVASLGPHNTRSNTTTATVDRAMTIELHQAAFVLSLTAMAVPMLQLVEQAHCDFGTCRIGLQLSAAAGGVTAEFAWLLRSPLCACL